MIIADLEMANLSGAGLHKAYLNGANLKKARLAGANLSDAQLSAIHSNDFPWATHKYGQDEFSFPVQQYHGPISPANVDECDLTMANLQGTNIRGVNLRSVKGLTIEQLSQAAGNDYTKIPTYLENQERLIRAAWRRQPK
jgi:uncharacterized protein YjbI with pentapeptide repeats